MPFQQQYADQREQLRIQHQQQQQALKDPYNQAKAESKDIRAQYDQQRAALLAQRDRMRAQYDQQRQQLLDQGRPKAERLALREQYDQQRAPLREQLEQLKAQYSEDRTQSRQNIENLREQVRDQRLAARMQYQQQVQQLQAQRDEQRAQFRAEQKAQPRPPSSTPRESRPLPTILDPLPFVHGPTTPIPPAVAPSLEPKSPFAPAPLPSSQPTLPYAPPTPTFAEQVPQRAPSVSSSNLSQGLISSNMMPQQAQTQTQGTSPNFNFGDQYAPQFPIINPYLDQFK